MMISELIPASGVTLGLLIAMLAFRVNLTLSESKRVNSLGSMVLHYRKVNQPFWVRFKNMALGTNKPKKNTKGSGKKAKATTAAKAWETLNRADHPFKIKGKEFTTFKNMSPAIFSVLLGLVGLTLYDFTSAILFAIIGGAFGIALPSLLIVVLYKKYQNDITTELSEIMTYIVELRQSGKNIPDSIRGSLFSTRQINFILERLLQDIAIKGSKTALAKFSNETDIKELKDFADILLQSLNIDNTNMEEFMLSRSRDIDYLEGLKKQRQFKNRKMLVEALTTIPFVMIPVILLAPLLIQANQSLSLVNF